MDPENQNFEKIKKTPEDIIILQICTINDNHMVYGSRDRSATDRIFLSFLDHVLPFYLPPPQQPEKSEF